MEPKKMTRKERDEVVTRAIKNGYFRKWKSHLDPCDDARVFIDPYFEECLTVREDIIAEDEKNNLNKK